MERRSGEEAENEESKRLKIHSYLQSFRTKQFQAATPKLQEEILRKIAQVNLRIMISNRLKSFKRIFNKTCLILT